MLAPPHPAPAVVVGLCAHGLSTVRELDRAGIRVLALEADKDIPGIRTRHAEIHFVSDINGTGLIEALLQLAQSQQFPVAPVLFLTNDRMVEVVGHNVETISPYYQLSWAPCTSELLPLLSKARIEKRCMVTGSAYPRSQVLEVFPGEASEIKPGFPVIVKPTRPLSAFKTIIADSFEELVAKRELVMQALPVLLQEYVRGDDDQIQFGALYLDAGRVVARFEGRKLHARPMGHTTIAVSEPDDDVHEMTTRFFSGLGLSGPVSLELKKGPDDQFWVMEPTVGRTDFWEGLCSANGISLPLIEFLSVTGNPVSMANQGATHMWVNGERFPAALVWLLLHAPKRLLSYRVRGVYFDLEDLGPYWASLGRKVGDLPMRVFRKIRKLFIRQ